MIFLKRISFSSGTNGPRQKDANQKSFGYGASASVFVAVRHLNDKPSVTNHKLDHCMVLLGN